MATFNWTNNPYFTTNRYKSPHGSDVTGDGTANKPYRTIQKCIDSGGLSIQCAPEVIREIFTGGPTLYLEPGCIVDTFVNDNYAVSTRGGKIVGGKFNPPVLRDAMFMGNLSGNHAQATANSRFNFVFKGYSITSYYFGNNGGNIYKGTIIKHRVNFPINNTGTLVYPMGINRCIFVDCLIFALFPFAAADPNSHDFNLFWNCSFSFGTDALANGLGTYYSLSQLESIYGMTGIDAVRAYYNARFGSNNVFNYSRIANPLFNNPDCDDYTLQANSPARHMAYDGTYIGAIVTGKQIGRAHV